MPDDTVKKIPKFAKINFETAKVGNIKLSEISNEDKNELTLQK